MYRFMWVGFLSGLWGLIAPGCGQPRAELPSWKPDAAARQCMELYDQNGDGVLTPQEYRASPALAAAPDLDVDGDRNISEQEIKDRIEHYKESGVVIQFMCYVVLPNGQPLPDATVRLVPEPFLTDFIQSVEGQTGRDGMCNIEDTQAGLYRVEITHPQLNIAKKYNTDTELGYEVSPSTKRDQAGPPRYQVSVGR